MRHGTLYIGIRAAFAFSGTARAADLFTPSLLVPDVNTERFICMATNILSALAATK